MRGIEELAKKDSLNDEKDMYAKPVSCRSRLSHRTTHGKGRRTQLIKIVPHNCIIVMLIATVLYLTIRDAYGSAVIEHIWSNGM